MTARFVDLPKCPDPDCECKGAPGMSVLAIAHDEAPEHWLWVGDVFEGRDELVDPERWPEGTTELYPKLAIIIGQPWPANEAEFFDRTRYHYHVLSHLVQSVVDSVHRSSPTQLRALRVGCETGGREGAVMGFLLAGVNGSLN